jgi:putative transposase
LIQSRGIFQCSTINQKYATGKTLFQHQVIRRNAREYAKSSVNMNNLMEAADRIEEVVEKVNILQKQENTIISKSCTLRRYLSELSTIL